MKHLLLITAALIYSALGFAQDCATPPTNLQLTNLNSCSAKLSWNAVPNATKYKVKYKIASGGSWSTPVSAGNNLSYTFTGLDAGVKYKFAVNDQCPDGNKSKYANISGKTTTCTLPVLNGVEVLSSSSLKLDLTASCSYDSIRVEYHYNNLPDQYYATTDINNVVLTNLLPNTTYTIKVSTCKLSANNWTSTVTATTLPASTKPNILLIVLDDSRYDTYGCNYGPSWFTSPNIDRIANEGVNFKYNFVTTSYCTPSRSSIVTGLYAHHHGAIDNSTPIYDSLQTVNQVLKNNGYYTGMIGKWIAQQAYPIFNFSMSGDNDYINPTYTYQGQALHLTGHSTDILTDTSIAFLKRAPRPFFLWLGYKATHDPIVPQSSYTNLYLNNSMPVPTNDYFWADDYPSYIQSLGFSIPVDSIAPQYLSYFQCLKGVDDAIGKILDTLDNMNILDSTMVIFMSDNGMILGEHLLHTKRYGYDPSTRVPLFIRYPAWFTAGTVITNQMSLNIDLTPTILEAAGIGYDSLHVDGISLHNIYNGSASRTQMFYEYLGKSSTGGFPTMLSVRSFQYKYIKSGCNTTTEEFYDLINDPQENTNQIFNSAYSALIDTYRNKLTSMETQYGYNYVSPIQNCHIVNNFRTVADEDEQYESPTFSVAPNPSGGSFDLVNPFDENYSLDVINDLGIPVDHLEVSSGENEISLRRMKPGIYQLHLLSDSGKETTIRMTIAR